MRALRPGFQRPFSETNLIPRTHLVKHLVGRTEHNRRAGRNDEMKMEYQAEAKDLDGLPGGRIY